MKEIMRLVGVMTLFAVVSGVLLAWTNSVTSEPIARALRAETMDGLKKVLPDYDNDLIADARKVEDGGREWNFYVARRGGVFAGVAFEASSDRGYGGSIRLLVGVSTDGNVRSVQVLQADKETPGLGSKVREAKFLDQFRGRPASDTGWASVRKDGGEIDAVTGATISSRAVAGAVKEGLDVFARRRDEIVGK